MKKQQKMVQSTGGREERLLPPLDAYMYNNSRYALFQDIQETRDVCVWINCLIGHTCTYTVDGAEKLTPVLSEDGEMKNEKAATGEEGVIGMGTRLYQY